MQKSTHLHKLAQQLHKLYYPTIITTLVLWFFPLFNAFCIWGILQNVEFLCKHVHNKCKWIMSLLQSFDFKKTNVKKDFSFFKLHANYTIDTLPNSLIDSTASWNVKTMEGKGVAECSLVCNISGVEGRARDSEWGLGWVKNGSIIHTDLHKPNNKFVSV
jgi:hypothetical protein